MVGRITADLGAELIREVEEVDRIASTSRNLKGTYVRRLRQSRKVRAVGAELQQHTGAAFGAPASSQEIEREGERERERERRKKERGRMHAWERGWGTSRMRSVVSKRRYSNKQTRKRGRGRSCRRSLLETTSTRNRRRSNNSIPGAPTAIVGLLPHRLRTRRQCRAISAVLARR